MHSGLCLIAHQALEAGQEIIVKSVVMPSSQRAAVRWHQNIDKDAYKVGLEFVR